MVLSHDKSGDVATRKSMMASVSVIIPVYNGEQYIRETLESVFAQTYQDYEIVCVDDGSEDASLAILNEYRDRIKVVQHANTGQAGARNAGARTGIGKYIAFLDHDDRWYPQKLERQVAVLEATPEAVMVHCDMDWIDGTGHVTQRSVVSASRRSVHKGVTMPQLVGWDPCIYPSSMLIRRVAFDRIGGFDSELRYGDDIDLMLRLRQEGLFIFLEEAGTQYRKHSTNFSGSGTEAMFRCAEKFFRKLKGRYVGDERRQALLNRFLAQVYSDWGKMKMRSGLRGEAQRLLLRSLQYYPWQFRTYSRLIRATASKF
jgi:glycosyltransferase involved in cell wall biosynthesis